MSDEGSDLCECLIWSYEVAMQRFLSILRETQAYCSDTECFSLPSLPGPNDTSSSSNLVMMMMMVGMAGLLYVLRPASLRQIEDSKPRSHGPGSNNGPPTPPTAN
ncbi:small integral membrane protein 14 [Orussus abietinus]|uniref:small integral membrane protein 14 n=1 Tax=Orussus abietinus TaxID=222816 RepID=UPI000626994A|nr:small integral membrane protein 14 [Orussus abietinus]XP_012277893.1 small integral membrane protein 14 [Orussus abietinus]